MDSIDNLFAITNELRHSVLNGQHEDRSKKINELTAYIDLRGKILDSINQDLLTSDDKQKLKEIHVLSEEIIKQMEKIKTSIQHNILQTKKGKSAFKGYNDPYASSSFDGSYIDKRK
ncbi:hypothetical protein V7127_20965 [Bacillus sp. JJ1773]|uniref:hypothetical protein n=1 Tax=Bacillus sp. JJ1773 TaxID=3122965 RepID=UPI002FFE6ED4